MKPRDPRVDPRKGDHVQVGQFDRAVHDFVDGTVFYYECGVLGKCSLSEWREWAKPAQNFMTKAQ